MEKSIKDQFLSNYEKLPYFVNVEFFKDKEGGADMCPQVAINGTLKAAMVAAAGIVYSIHTQSHIPVEGLWGFFSKELAAMVMPGSGAAVDMMELEKMGGG